MQPVSSQPVGNSAQGALVHYSTVHEETLIRVDVLGVDSDGFLADIDVQSIPEVPKTTLKDRSRDVDHFFSPSYQNKGKNYRNCRICS